MWDLCGLIWWALVGLRRSRASLEAECIALRQQINVLRRTAPRRPRFGNIDRLVFVGLYRLFPSVRDALRIVQPETVIGWHRAGFRAYWRCKIETSRRKANDVGGDTPTDPCHEPCEPTMGRAADSRRTPQARHRHRADERGEVYGAAQATAISGLEDFSFATMPMASPRSTCSSFRRFRSGSSTACWSCAMIDAASCGWV